MAEDDAFIWGKKKPKKPRAQATSDIQATPDEQILPSDEPDYTYQEMLAMLSSKLSVVPESVKIPAPVVGKEGTKVTIIVNFRDICGSVCRSTELTMLFFSVETGSKVSLAAGGSALRLWGVYRQLEIERILKKFIVGYVRCSGCKGLSTSLVKVKTLSTITCRGCGGNRTVTAIRARKTQTQDDV